MSGLEQCPLCERPLGVGDGDWKIGFNVYKVNCAVCKKYQVTNRATDHLKELTRDQRLVLSAVVRRHFELGEWETITEHNYQLLASRAPEQNDVPSKVRYLLGYVAHKSRFPGDKIALNDEVDYPICFAANTNEFKFYVQYAKEVGFLNQMRFDDPPGWRYWLTTKGWEETRRILTLDSPYAFVAMSFDKKGKHADLLHQAFKEAIQPAIEDDAGYQAVRIDKEQFLGDIVFEIMARIKECRFVVADVTEHRHGVYFEAGYAMGMGLPVIWTCYEDDMKEAHFDTNHLNHIVWKDISELRKSLKNRILGTSIGKCPKRKSGD